MNSPQHRWFGISGTWRTTNGVVENDVRSAVREITSRGDGVITGGALGVDYIAIDEALKSYPDATKLKVVIPASFDSYIEHLKAWASGYDTGDPAITKAEADLLIDQLTKMRRANPAAIVEASSAAAEDIRKDAYFARNTVIAQLLDELLAFQVNNSAGTQDTIDKARALGKQVIVRSYSE